MYSFRLCCLQICSFAERWFTRYFSLTFSVLPLYTVNCIYVHVHTSSVTLLPHTCSSNRKLADSHVHAHQPYSLKQPCCLPTSTHSWLQLRDQMLQLWLCKGNPHITLTSHHSTNTPSGPVMSHLLPSIIPCHTLYAKNTIKEWNSYRNTFLWSIHSLFHLCTITFLQLIDLCSMGRQRFLEDSAQRRMLCQCSWAS